MKCRISVCVLILCLGLPVLAAAQTLENYRVKVEHNTAVKMRDGVTLYADIYHPDADGKFPVLLQRTPYDKQGWSGDTSFFFKAAARGYVVVVQDVRGRFSSEGNWTPFFNEAKDGYDTIEWAAALPYSNGKVGMFGGSYVGATQMLAATAHPPHLAGICPVVTASNYHENWTYQGGAFEQWFNESWSSGLAADTVNRNIRSSTNALTGDNVLPLENYPLFNTPHPGEADISARAVAPYFLDWLNHPEFDDYWKAVSIESHYSEINVPALHTGAWYDIFLGGSLRNYLGLKEHAATPEARTGPASARHHRWPRRFRPPDWRS